MRRFNFDAESGMDDEIVKKLDTLSMEEQNNFFRKALNSYIQSNPVQESKGRTNKHLIRPEPHGYPVE